MTGRLKDEAASSDPALARLSELCRKTAPTRVDVSARVRVLASLEEAPTGRPSRLFKFATVAASLIIVSTAFAMLGPLREKVFSRVSSEKARPPTVHVPSVQNAAPTAVAAPLPLESPPEAPVSIPRPIKRSAIVHSLNPSRIDAPHDLPPATTAPLVEAPATAPSTSLAIAPADSPTVTKEAPVLAAPSAEETRLVHEAARALRVDNSPRRAAQLLNEYLARFPDGAILEEALALSIESSAVMNDPRAGTFAHRYLARFPSGRFAAMAREAIR